MYAVIKTGGKQYRVKENQTFSVEKIEGESGSSIVLGDVLMLENGSDVMVGAPFVSGAQVVASIVEQVKGDKVLIFKKKRRHNYRRKKGHRQLLTVLKIDQIAKPGDAVNLSASSQKKTVSPAKSEAVSGEEPKKKAAAPKVKASDAGEEKASPKSKASPKTTKKTQE